MPKSKDSEIQQELNPCPFCGSKAELETLYNFGKNHDEYHISCSEGCVFMVHYDKGQAIEKWNTRSIPDEHISGYCPECGACGEPGCCPTSSCKYVNTYQGDYDELIEDLNKNRIEVLEEFKVKAVELLTRLQHDADEEQVAGIEKAIDIIMARLRW